MRYQQVGTTTLRSGCLALVLVYANAHLTAQETAKPATAAVCSSSICLDEGRACVGCGENGRVYRSGGELRAIGVAKELARGQEGAFVRTSREWVDRTRRRHFTSAGTLRARPLPLDRTQGARERRTFAVADPIDPAEVDHLAAVASYRRGDIEVAIARSAAAALGRPHASAYWSNLGYYLHVNGDHDRALVCFEHARKVNPNNESAWIGILVLALHHADVTPTMASRAAREWSRRERDPDVRRVAIALYEELRQIVGGRAREANGDSGDGDEASLRRLREVLREFLAEAPTVPSSDVSTVSSPEVRTTTALSFRSGANPARRTR